MSGTPPSATSTAFTDEASTPAPVLHLDPRRIRLIVGALLAGMLLASTIVMPLYGKVGDLVGRRRPFLVAIALFTAASVGASVTSSFTAFVVWRALQGMGAGGLMILAQAIIADIIPARDRGRYLGVMGAMFGVSSVAGPLLGGFLTDSSAQGWRVCFALNIPVGVAALVIAWRTLTLPHRRDPGRLDIAGIALMALATASLVLFSEAGSDDGWGSARALVLLAVSAVSAVAFVVVERRADQPLIPMTFFTNRAVVIAVTLGALVGLGMFVVVGYLPTFLQMSSGYSASGSGLLMLPLIVGMLGAVVLSGSATSRTGRYRRFPVAGMVAFTLALVWMTTLSGTTSMWLVEGMLLVAGAGIGLTMQIVVLVAQNAVPSSDVGAVTSTGSYLKELGATLGVALFGSLFTSGLSTRLHGALVENAAAARSAGISSVDSIVPAAVRAAAEPLRSLIVSAYADSLSPVYGYLLPFFALALVLALLLPEIPLADQPGMVARGEAVYERQ